MSDSCNTMDSSLLCSSVHGILKAKEYWSGLPFPSPGDLPTLCNPIDGSPPGSPVPGILQARIKSSKEDRCGCKMTIAVSEGIWVSLVAQLAAFPSGCLPAQTKRWAEGIRVPAPLAGRGMGWPWEAQSSPRVARESWGWRSSHCRA